MNVPMAEVPSLQECAKFVVLEWEGGLKQFLLWRKDRDAGRL